MLSDSERQILLDQFISTRKEQCDTADEIIRSINDRQRYILVSAEEKSGKREIKKIVALKHCGNNYLHIYLVGLNRRDIKPQLQEFEHIGVETHIVRDASHACSIALRIRRAISDGLSVFIHLDECDYATGAEQLLQPLTDVFLSLHNVFLIAYSATPQEPLFSHITFKLVNFRPHPHYRGARWFLNNNLVRSPCHFFLNADADSQDAICLSPQGLEIVQHITNHPQQKNLAVVRLTGRNGGYEKFRSFYHDLDDPYEKLGFIACFVDQHNEFQWSKRSTWIPILHSAVPYIIFINQTCTRSTEIHPDALRLKLSVWHDSRYLKSSDNRDGKTLFNTLSQAQGRIKHYHPEGHDIIAYIDPDVWLFQTGIKDWNLSRIAMSSRIISQTSHISSFDIGNVERVCLQFRSFEDLSQYVATHRCSVPISNPAKPENLQNGYYKSGPTSTKKLQLLKPLIDKLTQNRDRNYLGGWTSLKAHQTRFRTYIAYESNTFISPAALNPDNPPIFVLYQITNNSDNDITFDHSSFTYSAKNSLFNAEPIDPSMLSENDLSHAQVALHNQEKSQQQKILDHTTSQCASNFISSCVTTTAQPGSGLHHSFLLSKFKDWCLLHKFHCHKSSFFLKKALLDHGFHYVRNLKISDITSPGYPNILFSQF
jgi:hypothetical protein